MNPEQALREFHEFFGLPARDEVQGSLPQEELDLRRNLIEEEFDETMDEIRDMEFGFGNVAKLYKELADLVYVCYGLDQHLGSKLPEVFAEVHRSNMTKLWSCWDCDGLGKAHCICEGTGKRVKYRDDGKVLKPPTYEAPDIEKVINS